MPDLDRPGRVRGASARMLGTARGLRRRETTAEAVLWGALRGRQLGGLKFRRQQPAGPFVLDFFCAEHALAVEVDGGVHERQTEQDAFRTDYLVAHGLRVLRFRNAEIVGDLAGVLGRIVRGASPPHGASPPPPAGGTPSPTAAGEGGMRDNT